MPKNDAPGRFCHLPPPVPKAEDYEPLPRLELGLTEVAEMIAMDERTVKRAAKLGKLRGYKVLGRFRFTRADVATFIRACEIMK